MLLDDVQRGYYAKYYAFWESVVKDIAGATGLFVVIATTYDLSTPESPACFKGLQHVDAFMNEDEADSLLQMHYENWGYENWEGFRSMQLKLSISLQSVTTKPLFHIGVMMAGIRMLNDLRKQSDQPPLTEERALEELRGREFVAYLSRCFGLPTTLPEGFNDQLVDAVIGKKISVQPEDPVLGPFLRAGVLNKNGKFPNMAASWFYNEKCFPNRAGTTPANLDSLVKSVIPLLSTRRLCDTLDNGFPKEATFQHLFNEEMSKLLTLHNKIIPELNTKVDPTPGSNGTGELDFYINGNLKWCLELLRNGDKINNHLERFDPSTGRYRNAEKMNVANA